MITDSTFLLSRRFYVNVFMLSLIFHCVFKYPKRAICYEILCLFRRRFWGDKNQSFYTIVSSIFMVFKVAQTEARIYFVHSIVLYDSFFTMRTMRANSGKICKWYFVAPDSEAMWMQNINNRCWILKFIFTLKF